MELKSKKELLKRDAKKQSISESMFNQILFALASENGLNNNNNKGLESTWFR